MAKTFYDRNVKLNLKYGASPNTTSVSKIYSGFAESVSDAQIVNFIDGYSTLTSDTVDSVIVSNAYSYTV